jgi:hypothetical protein
MTLPRLRILGRTVRPHEEDGVCCPRSTEALDVNRPRGGEDCGRVKTADLDEPVTGDALKGDVFLNFHKRSISEFWGNASFNFVFL